VFWFSRIHPINSKTQNPFHKLRTGRYFFAVFQVTQANSRDPSTTFQTGFCPILLQQMLLPVLLGALCAALLASGITGIVLGNKWFVIPLILPLS
jgi:hypothetical protein